MIKHSISLTDKIQINPHIIQLHYYIYELICLITRGFTFRTKIRLTKICPHDPLN